MMEHRERKMENNTRRNRSSPDMPIMRIAIAGTGGLACLIAQQIQEETSHHVIFLSRSQQPQSAASGVQVVVVDYSDAGLLRYTLQGIDTVISTFSGQNQIALIHAAVAARVRRFAPAEFEGLPRQNAANNPLDRGRHYARQLLDSYSDQIQSTTFVCGILYERFQPGGLAGSRMGAASPGLSGEGDFIINTAASTVQFPAHDPRSPTTTICMTAAQDVARFVCRSLDLPTWPAELRMCGVRTSVRDLVALAQAVRQQPFEIQWHTPASLTTARQSAAQLAVAQGNAAPLYRIQALVNTLNGDYDYTSANLNQWFSDIRPVDFRTWYLQQWSSQ